MITNLNEITRIISGYLGSHPDSFSQNGKTREILISICDQYSRRSSVSDKQEAILNRYYPIFMDLVNKEADSTIASDNPNLRQSYLKNKYSYKYILVTEGNKRPDIIQKVADKSIRIFTLLDAHFTVVKWINNEELADLNKARAELGFPILYRFVWVEEQKKYFIPSLNQWYQKESSEFNFPEDLTPKAKIDRVVAFLANGYKLKY